MSNPRGVFTQLRITKNLVMKGIPLKCFKFSCYPLTSLILPSRALLRELFETQMEVGSVNEA